PRPVRPRRVRAAMRLSSPLGRAVVVIVLLGLIPVVAPGYTTRLASLTLIYALLAMAIDIMAGYPGRTPLCHGAIFGVATYVVLYWTRTVGGPSLNGGLPGLSAAALGA